LRPYLAPPPPPGVERGPRPTFSVVIGAYQAASTVGEAVRSALEQTEAPHQVVVVDDGSTDGTEAALGPYREHIVYFRKENGGGASALNAAIELANGDFISILDADDRYAPARLEALADIAEERPDLDLLGTDSYLEVAGRLVARFSDNLPFAVERQEVKILEGCFVPWPAVRRDVLLRKGGYDESLRIAYDWECYMRLILHGSRAGYVPVPLHYYRIASGTLSGARAETLRERVTILRRAEQHAVLHDDQRRALARSIREVEIRALLAEAADALVSRSSDARRRAVAVAVGSGFGPRTRLKAVFAAVAPRAAGRALEAKEASSGQSRLKRGLVA
jgi:glycosyltransferase involved in cell wall biosynthesis